MRALTVHPGHAGSLELRSDVPEPKRASGQLIVEGWLLGVCGTDREIASGSYGQAPEGAPWLVLGHECVGKVVEADPKSPFHAGDWVVGIVRRPDPVPCGPCAAGEWDMCSNGLYTERGIRGQHGYGSQRYLLEEIYGVHVPKELGEAAVLLEPTSIVAKAWEQVERIAQRSKVIDLKRVLVTGAGPVGLLAAMIGTQRGYDVTVLDVVTEGPKPELVKSLGAKYHVGSLDAIEPSDIVLECTGVSSLVVEVLSHTARNSVVCLAGVCSGARKVELRASTFNNDLVLENNVVFGSVNANRRHYEAALSALARADKGWLERMITRKVPLSKFQDAFVRKPGDVKVAIDLRA